MKPLIVIVRRPSRRFTILNTSKDLGVPGDLFRLVVLWGRHLYIRIIVAATHSLTYKIRM